jgi:hypothetical protein
MKSGQVSPSGLDHNWQFKADRVKYLFQHKKNSAASPEEYSSVISKNKQVSFKVGSIDERKQILQLDNSQNIYRDSSFDN